MNFDLSDEQYALQDTVRRYLAAEAATAQIIELYKGNNRLDRTCWTGLARLGVTGICVPEAYGGLGLELLDLAIVAEVLGYCAAPGPFLGHAMATLALVHGADQDQRQRWLPRMASGELLATVAFAEPGERWQPEQWALVAADDKLSGTKHGVIAGAEADLIVVGLADGELAVVEKAAPGMTVDELDGIDRTRRIAELSLENTPCDVLPNGRSASKRVRDAGLVLLAADAFGGASRSVELTVEYANTREQFGKTIAQFQSVKHQIADTVTRVEPSRGLYWYAAYAYDHAPEDSARLAALAKAHLTDGFVEASRKMLELHGGIGYTWEFYVHVWMKRAIFDRQFLGMPADHRERAAELAGW